MKVSPASAHPGAHPAATSRGAAPAPGVVVRRLAATDSVPEITRLLHRAYAKQVAMGLRPLAGRQDDATTARRCGSGECYVAVIPGSPPHAGRSARGRVQRPSGGERIVGVILFHEVEDAEGPAWFRRKDVDYFSQFAVDPDVQGLGIGRLLLDKAEQRARECGAVELGLSMAEPDRDLYDYYIRRGYRLIEYWQWPYTNYRSAILSKRLGSA